MIRRRWMVVLILYLGLLGGVAWGLSWTRAEVLRTLDTPAAREQWQAWKRDTQAPPALDSPVHRRPVRVDDPPGLILFRDFFPAVLLISELLVSALFLFLVFVGQGLGTGREIEQVETGSSAEGN